MRKMTSEGRRHGQGQRLQPVALPTAGGVGGDGAASALRTPEHILSPLAQLPCKSQPYICIQFHERHVVRFLPGGFVRQKVCGSRAPTRLA